MRQNFSQSRSYGFRDINIFQLRKNQRWPPKIKFFSFLPTTPLYYPVGQKFGRNRSTSYGFRDINLLCFPQKFKMAAKNAENYNFLKFHTG